MITTLQLLKKYYDRQSVTLQIFEKKSIDLVVHLAYFPAS